MRGVQYNVAMPKQESNAFTHSVRLLCGQTYTHSKEAKTGVVCGAPNKAARVTENNPTIGGPGEDIVERFGGQAHGDSKTTVDMGWVPKENLSCWPVRGKEGPTGVVVSYVGNNSRLEACPRRPSLEIAVLLKKVSAQDR